MINFNDGWSPRDFSSNKKSNIQLTKSQIKKIIQKLMESSSKFSEGSYHGGLNPSHVTEIIKYILYTESRSFVDVKILVESDGYHLGVLIKERGEVDYD